MPGRPLKRLTQLRRISPGMHWHQPLQVRAQTAHSSGDIIAWRSGRGKAYLNYPDSDSPSDGRVTPLAVTSSPFHYFAGLEVHRDTMVACVYDASERQVGYRAKCSAHDAGRKRRFIERVYPHWKNPGAVRKRPTAARSSIVP